MITAGDRGRGGGENAGIGDAPGAVTNDMLCYADAGCVSNTVTNLLRNLFYAPPKFSLNDDFSQVRTA